MSLEGAGCFEGVVIVVVFVEEECLGGIDGFFVFVFGD